MNAYHDFFNREYPNNNLQEHIASIQVEAEEAPHYVGVGCHDSYPHLTREQVALIHFGIPQLDAQGLLDLINQTVDLMVEHLWGDWWTKEKMHQWIKEHEQHIEGYTIESYPNGRPSSAPTDRRERELYREEANGTLFAAVFARRYEELARICDWYDMRIEPGLCMGDVEPEYHFGILYLISRFRSEPIPGIEKALAKVKKCRHERPKALVNLIDAVFDQDLEAYHEWLPQSLKLHFHRLKIIEVPSHLIAFEQSILAEYARQQGMELPPLEGRALYALATPQSLGLEA